MEENNKTKLIPMDFRTKWWVKWCPWCGNFITLNRLSALFADSWKNHEDFVVVAWIWCAWRLPYYLNTYWFHTIHGRAPSFATWVKLSNPELDVWVITWDWDSLSIWTNHFIHTIRKNIWVRILLLNNSIYWLTKWQLSPTSPKWMISRTTPNWSIDEPIDAVKLALSVRGSFIARTIDNDIALTDFIFNKAMSHKWTVLIESLQKCVTFNPNSHEQLRAENSNRLYLEHWKPLIFWKEKNIAVVADWFSLKPVNFSWEIPENTVIYDETDYNLANLVASIDFATPIWIIFRENRESYESELQKMYTKSTKDEILRWRNSFKI